MNKRCTIKVDSDVAKKTASMAIKPWYAAYAGEKFDVEEDGIGQYRLLDKDWCKRFIGVSTATISANHCLVSSSNTMKNYDKKPDSEPETVGDLKKEEPEVKETIEQPIKQNTMNEHTDEEAKIVSKLKEERMVVIANYPKSPYTVGERIPMNPNLLLEYPNIFKKVEWWEGLLNDLNTMTAVKYVRITKYVGYWRENDVVKVIGYDIDLMNNPRPVFNKYILEYKHEQKPDTVVPATYQEYVEWEKVQRPHKNH